MASRTSGQHDARSGADANGAAVDLLDVAHELSGLLGAKARGGTVAMGDA